MNNSLVPLVIVIKVTNLFTVPIHFSDRRTPYCVWSYTVEVECNTNVMPLTSLEQDISWFMTSHHITWYHTQSSDITWHHIIYGIAYLTENDLRAHNIYCIRIRPGICFVSFYGVIGDLFLRRWYEQSGHRNKYLISIDQFEENNISLFCSCVQKSLSASKWVQTQKYRLNHLELGHKCFNL